MVTVEEQLAVIRGLGWACGNHNEYRLRGVRHSFWLFTNSGLEVHGEDETDDAALGNILDQIDHLGVPQPIVDHYERWVNWVTRLRQYHDDMAPGATEEGRGAAAIAGDICLLEERLQEATTRVAQLQAMILSGDKGEELGEPDA